jgi:hypothetical protein
MSCFISGVSVLNTTGLVDGFLNLWMTAWFKSCIVASPTLLVVAPLTRRLVGELVADATRWRAAKDLASSRQKTGSILQETNPRPHRNPTTSKKGTKGSIFVVVDFKTSKEQPYIL